MELNINLFSSFQFSIVTGLYKGFDIMSELLFSSVYSRRSIFMFCLQRFTGNFTQPVSVKVEIKLVIA